MDRDKKNVHFQWKTSHITEPMRVRAKVTIDH